MAVLASLQTGLIRAEDFVVLKPTGNARSGTRVTGTITEYTGRELLIRMVSGRESRIPADRVADVFTKYSQKKIDADLLFSEHRYAEAAALFRQAVADEPRQWVRREILARVVRCSHNQHRLEPAAATFLLIVENDPTTQYFGAIPLVWRSVRLGLAAQRQAEQWLRDDGPNPVAQLIAASWLLTATAENRAESQRVLEELTRVRDLRIALLAEAQLWRTRVVVAKEAELHRWQTAIDRMPNSLRAGPYYLLAQALSRQGKYEQSALAAMRVPVLYPQQQNLVAETLLVAADALEKNNRIGEARSCWQELLRDFPESTAAAVAKSKLSNAPTGG